MVYFFNWLKSILLPKTRENLLAVTCGDVVFFHILGVPPEISALGEKMLSTMILAALGGAAGWAGKELIMWITKQLGKLFNSLRKKKP